MEKKKAFIINTLYIAIILALVYFGITYVLDIVFPFVLGFIFAYLAIKVCQKFTEKDSKIYRVITLLLIYVLIILIIWLLVNLGISKMGDFIKTLPGFYKTTVEPYISSLQYTLQDLGDGLPDFIAGSLNNLTGDIFNTVKSLLSSLASGLVNVTSTALASAPQLLISVIVTIVTSFYFVVDYEYIADWFEKHLPEKVVNVLGEIQDFFENILVKILSAYVTIMFITFIELFIGLTIFGVNNGGMWAIIIALLDIFPVLGVGTVLIPWGVSSLITGNVVLGIELLVLYFIISFIRNIIEPKFVGTNLNLHPLATLFSMIVGLRLFGAVGMFGLPLTISFFRSREEKKDMSK